MPWASADELPKHLQGLTLEDANAWGAVYDRERGRGTDAKAAAAAAWRTLPALRKGVVRFRLLRKAERKGRAVVRAGPTQEVHIGPHLAHNPHGTGLHLVTPHERTMPKAAPKEKKAPTPKGEPAKGPEVTTGGDTTSVWIRAGRLSAFTAAVAALAKKATRLGLTPPIATPTGETRAEELKTYTITGKMLHGGWAEFHEFQVTNPAFNLPGWALHAKVEPRGNDSMVHVMRGAEDVAIPKKYGDGADHCDHCKLKRRRTSLFLLKRPGKSGPTAWKQVGGECVKDFLGQDATLLEGAMGLSGALNALLKEELASGLSDGFQDSKYLDPLIVLTLAWADVAQHGYGKADSTRSTRESVADALVRIRRGEHSLDTGKNDEYLNSAINVRDWVQALPKGPPGDFMEKLRVVFADPLGIRKADLGLAVYAVEAYRRAKGEEAKSKVKAAAPVLADPYIGKPGDKIGGTQTAAEKKAGVERLPPLVLTLTHSDSRDNDYGGTTTRMEFVDEAGRNVVWWASRGPDIPGPHQDSSYPWQMHAPGHREHVDHVAPTYSEELKPGRRYLIHGGTIKNTDEFRGQKRTVLTAAKIVAIPSDAEVRAHYEQYAHARLNEEAVPYGGPEYAAKIAEFRSRHGLTDADHTAAAAAFVKYHHDEIKRLSAPPVLKRDKLKKAYRGRLVLVRVAG